MTQTHFWYEIKLHPSFPSFINVPSGLSLGNLKSLDTDCSLFYHAFEEKSRNSSLSILNMLQ